MLINRIKSIFFSKYFLIWILSATVGIYIRLYPLYNFTSNDVSEKTTLLVLTNIQKKIALQVQMNYPLLPEKEKNAMAKKLFDELLRKQGQKLRETIDEASLNIQKNSPQMQNHPYLLASDSFYYYELTENIIKDGKISDQFKGSKYLNRLMLAPQGHWEPLNLHPWIGFFIYKIQQIFNPEIDLMYAVSFTPLLITVLALIPFILICRRLKCNGTTTLISTLFFVLAPIFVKRSTFGWYDNDPYSTLFPLCILASLFQGLSIAKNSERLKDDPSAKTNDVKKKLIGPAMWTSIFFMLYAVFWQGWVFMFAVILGSSIVIFFYNLIFLRKTKRSPFIRRFLFASCLGGFVCVSVIFGANEFFVLFAEGWKALKNFMAPQLSLWPDIYISVSELHKADLKYIIEHTGGLFFFCITMVGFISAFFDIKRSPKETSLYESIFVVVFFLISMVITFGAQRFVMLCLVPMSLLFALGLQCLFNQGMKIIPNSAPKTQQKAIQGGLIVTFLLLAIIPYHRINHSVKSLLNLIYNDTWDTALKEIKEKTPENSIINTWWPPGHFIKAMADRSVTFDGATINFPQAYWMANVFLSNTEEDALGIIRMLNNSGNDAADYLSQTKGIPLSVSIQMLKEITSKPKEEARELLQKGLNDPQTVEHLLSLTHATPPSSYCLVYKEFVDANLQLGFFGNWNFQTVEEINKNPELIKKVPKKNSKAYIDFLWNLVGGPLKYSSPLPLINQQGDKLFFQGDIIVDLQSMQCAVNSSTYGHGVPHNIFYLENDTVQEKTFPGPTLPFSAVLFKQETSYNLILLDEQLAKSLLVRLYFFEGKGLEYFHLFSKTSDLTGRNKIYVYAIDWKKFEEQ